jgi:two-component system nitrogen regulation response regulator NtrX
VEVNCAAIPEDLIESELFGHMKGSFTAAHERKIGKFQKADGGTLFLDEVGDMSLKTQAKVLRVAGRAAVRAGGRAGIVQVDVRVVAATNKNLEEEIDAGNFREDLFYRLNVIPVSRAAAARAQGRYSGAGGVFSGENSRAATGASRRN